MKKLILIPITLTALTPTIAMVGCNKPTPTEKIQFTAATGQMSSATVGTFQLDWTPTDHNIEFVNDWAFASSCGNAINVVADEFRPATLTLTFNNEITQNDITDGELAFTYNDLTTKEDNIPVILRDICITKFTPPEPDIQFTTVPGQMSSATVGTFQIDWTPTDHNLVFNRDWAFTSSCGNAISIVDDATRPATLTLTFNNEITQNDITDGELTFTYNDLTTKEDNIPVILRDICITKFTPPEPDIKFTATTGQMSSATVGTFQIDWTPTDHNLMFNRNWAFTSSCGNAINIVDDATRPRTLTLTFNKEIKQNDITDGKLTFTYNDLTTQEDNISVTIENINIIKYNPDSWKVTEQEMVDAITFVNVSYAQFKSYLDMKDIQGEQWIYADSILSPNGYHYGQATMHGQILQYGRQMYVFKEDDDSYTKYTRDLSTGIQWSEDEGSAREFISVEEVGNVNYLEYKQYIDEGVSFKPDEINKCYTATRQDAETTYTTTYYFNNKKLVKMATGQSFFEVKRQIEYDIDYQKVEVQKPDRYEYDINIDKTLPFSAPVLTGELPNIDTSAEFNLAIDCSYCEKSPVWDYPTSYIEFRDSLGLKITDIDFDVLFYSTDGTIFNHVSQAELDDGLYYCKDNMICAQTFTNVGANTKFQVLVKFNNHNGENINVYWSNRPL